MKFRSDCIIMYVLQEECDLMDTLYLAAVCAVVPGLGRSRIPDLINALGSARAVFEASAATLTATGLCTPRAVQSFISNRDARLPQRLDYFCRHNGVQILAYTDAAYPQSLQQLSDKPLVLYVKGKLPQAFVIAGNVGTPEAVIDLENWGADATKVGIGPGKVCITRLKTGFGTGGWQLSALKWCARVATKPIIADGGIRHHGDIAKSVRFGAAMVMIGSLFAGHEESPGKTVEVDGRLYKEYYGSASDFNKGEYKHVEGKRILEPIKGRLADTLREMQEDVQSSISYAGGTQLTDLKKVNYVILGGENAGEHLFM